MTAPGSLAAELMLPMKKQVWLPMMHLFTPAMTVGGALKVPTRMVKSLQLGDLVARMPGPMSTTLTV